MLGLALTAAAGIALLEYATTSFGPRPAETLILAGVLLALGVPLLYGGAAGVIARRGDEAARERALTANTLFPSDSSSDAAADEPAGTIEQIDVTRFANAQRAVERLVMWGAAGAVTLFACGGWLLLFGQPGRPDSALTAGIVCLVAGAAIPLFAWQAQYADTRGRLAVAGFGLPALAGIGMVEAVGAFTYSPVRLVLPVVCGVWAVAIVQLTMAGARGGAVALFPPGEFQRMRQAVDRYTRPASRSRAARAVGCMGLLVIAAGFTGWAVLVGSGQSIMSLPVVTLGLGGAVILLSRRIGAPTAAAAMAADARAPVLLLRSFGDDDRKLRMPFLSREHRGIGRRLGRLLGLGGLRFEELVAWTLQAAGPVIAVGQPGERLRRLGAAREYYPDGAWQDGVTERMRQAGFVACTVAASEGVAWEMERIEALGMQRRLLLVFPPESVAERQDRWAAFVTGSAHLATARSLAGLAPTAALAVLPGRDRPIAIVGLKDDARAYEVALLYAMYRLAVDASGALRRRA